MPLENVLELEEEILLTPMPKGCGYQISILGAISPCLIPFGGLDDAAVKPGDAVIIAPATGYFRRPYAELRPNSTCKFLFFKIP